MSNPSFLHTTSNLTLQQQLWYDTWSLTMSNTCKTFWLQSKSATKPSSANSHPPKTTILVLLTKSVLTYYDYVSTQKFPLPRTLTSSINSGVNNLQWTIHLTPQMLTNKHFSPIISCLLTTSHLKTPSLRLYPDVRSNDLQLCQHLRTYNVLPPAVCSDIHCLPSARSVASHFNQDYSYQMSPSPDPHACRTSTDYQLTSITTLDFIPLDQEQAKNKPKIKPRLPCMAITVSSNRIHFLSNIHYISVSFTHAYSDLKLSLTESLN